MHITMLGSSTYCDAARPIFLISLLCASPRAASLAFLALADPCHIACGQLGARGTEL